ncbi:Transporter [Polaromonas sp. CG9_12]|nr:putative membrane protein [Polaromonas sp. CG_9.11]CDS53800.1 Transporter [Polaromonas sp. CG9_12]
MMSSIRRWLLAGLLVLVPLAITLAVLNWIVATLDQTLLILPVAWHPDRLLGFHLPGFGVLLTLGIVLLMGAIASNFLGRKLLMVGNALLRRIPIVRSIYSSVKQVSDTLFSENGNAFRKALLVQWPREGVWTIGFLTGLPGGDVVNHLPADYVSVYVPTTPNPTGGYFVMLKRAECIELKMSVDEALTYVISMGVVVPAARPVPPLNPPL